MKKVTKFLVCIILIILFLQTISLAIISDNPDLELIKWHLLFEIILILLVPIFITFSWVLHQEKNNQVEGKNYEN